uniref:SCO-spondin n=1 Tax=Cacopsylla melanoneura TaxID=428564 RepID=A0A8D9AMH0_9HEMI
MKTYVPPWPLCMLFVISVIKSIEIQVPQDYTALSGDLVIHIYSIPPHADKQLYTQLLEEEYEQDPGVWKIMGVIPLNSSHYNTAEKYYEVRFPCGVITKGGKYGLRVHHEMFEYTEVTTFWNFNETLETTTTIAPDTMANANVTLLDVRWPSASLTLEPLTIETYPEHLITATIMWQLPNGSCQPVRGSRVPDTWLSLIYCGHNVDDCVLFNTNQTHYQILYTEKIRGYYKLLIVKLKCDLFGLAGQYSLALWPNKVPSGRPIATTARAHVIKAEVNSEYVFNVHARSIFPCFAHGGITVLFQYPKCILSSGDKVRLYGKVPADVSSPLSPSSQFYITEQKVTRGQHSLQFDCDLFNEHYVEYCFVYVSQGIKGTVSDVRSDCVPTYPVSDSDSGGWGPWSEWSPCSSTCVGGKRNRYRFCDSPPPQYGTKFCEGKALESQSCGNETGWHCQLFHWEESADSVLPAELPEVKEEIGPGCRCGCVVHLGAAKPRRMLATSSHSCPGHKPTMWLIKADPHHVIELDIEHLKLPCSQWLKIRTGDSILSHLTAHLTQSSNISYPLYSTGPLFFLEFFSDVPLSSLEECNGGFLIHAKQIEVKPKVSMKTATASINHFIVQLRRLTTVHLFISVALLLVLICSICLVIQYVVRYHKYNLARASDDEDYPYYSSEYTKKHPKRPSSAATSTSTLLSEVASLHKSKENNLNLNLRKEYEVEIQYHTNKSKSEKKVIIYEDDYEKGVRQLDDPSSDNTSLPTICEDSVYDQDNVTASTSTISESTLTGSVTSPACSLSELNDKQRKELQNRERMLNLVGSDLSLTGLDTDLEMDYYDYNVHNTSDVPGSFIGMDPAFCVWIPPFAPKVWDQEAGHKQHDSGNVTPVNEEDNKRLSLISNDTVLTLCNENKDATLTNKSNQHKNAFLSMNNQSKDNMKSNGNNNERNSLLLSERSTDVVNNNAKDRNSKCKDPLTLSNQDIREALIPDTPVKVHQAVIKKKELVSMEMADIKFVDDDEDEFEDAISPL